MNENDNQPIVDAMLDEWIGNRSPRPLSASELSNLRIDPQRAAELDQALIAALSDMRNRSSGSAISVYRKPKSYSPVYRVMVALAACWLVGVGIWAVVNRNRINNDNAIHPSIVVAEHPPTLVVDPTTKSTTTVASPKEEVAQNASTTKSVASKSQRESLSLDSLPFKTNDTVTLESKQASNRTDRLAMLDEREVVALIDRQMQQIWKNHNANPAAPIGGVAWIERVTQQILARSATAEEKDSFAKNDSPGLRLESLHRIAEGSEFAQVWAKRIAAHLLAVGPLSNRDLSPEGRAFVQWIRQEINQTHRLDSIVRSIVLANGIDSKSELSPDCYWWNEVGSRDKTAPAEVLATRFLGIRASCSRCHDAKTVASANQAQFWGIAAIMHGVDVGYSPTTLDTQLGIRKDAKALFYERNDSSMVAALPSLPDGKALQEFHGDASQVKKIAKQNLKALNDWMLQSDDFARSQTDFVWTTLFGRSLVANYSLGSTNGEKERLELADVLSQQFRSSDYDLSKIVIWIAASQAFSLESIRHDGNWYLTAGNKELNSHQQRQSLFASFPVPQDPSFRSLDKLAQWFDSSKVLGNERGAVLANPLKPTLPPGNSKSVSGNSNSSPKISAFTEPQVEYLVRSQSLPKSLQDEVDRMLKSNLAWNVLVDHAFCMTGAMTPPTVSDREAAQRILDMSRDKRPALFRIIASRL